MTKVYIVQALGWGDREDAFYNISAHSTRQLADKALKELAEQASADGLDDVITNVEVITVDA